MRVELQHAEAEGPNVRLDAIALIKSLRGHVLRRPCGGSAHEPRQNEPGHGGHRHHHLRSARGATLTYAAGELRLLIHGPSKPQVPDLDLARVAINKDVLELEVPVHDGNRPGVQVVDALEDLPGPVLEGAQVDLLVLAGVAAAEPKKGVGSLLGEALCRRWAARAVVFDAHLRRLSLHFSVMKLKRYSFVSPSTEGASASQL